MNQAERRQRASFTRRSLLIGAGQAALFGAVGWRLHELQVTEGGRYALLADQNRIFVQPLAPIRGNIRDRAGALLAESEESLEVAIIPALAGDLGLVLDRLGEMVRIDPERRQRVLAAARRQGRLYPIVVAGDLGWETFARLNVLAPELPGILVQAGMRRRYHHGSETGHVVGLIGPPEAAEIDSDPGLRLPGFEIGKSGVELGLEETLRGRIGEIRREIDARGRIVRDLEEREPVRGSDLVLTIDLALQRELLERMAGTAFSAVVGLDVRSGAILAMGSTPTYDTARIAAGISEAEWRALTESEGDPLVNKAVRGQYPPGSTFKMVTALAGLESGKVTEETPFICDGGIELSGHLFRCWRRDGHGRMRLHDALRESCDVYFYEVARRCGIERIAAVARRLGLGQATGCGIGGEKPGLIPDRAWKASARNGPWFAGETLHAAIGQGYVLATALQLAVMTARIATGRAVAPHIVAGGFDEAPPLGFDSAALGAVRAGMIAAVNEAGGTGASASLPIDGVLMAGKTGTAQVARASRDRSSESLPRRLRDHALFVGYAPAAEPRYAVAAIVEHGGSGAKSAAPLARDVMTMLIERDPAATPAYSLGGPARERAEASPDLASGGG